MVQGVVQKKNQDKVMEGMEKYGEGANYYSFWVNNTASIQFVYLVSNEWH